MSSSSGDSDLPREHIRARLRFPYADSRTRQRGGAPWSSDRPEAPTYSGAVMAPHRPSESRGKDAEKRAREIAALFGVPDFVYKPLLERKGSAHREISDGMVICGEDGLIMQVKARQTPRQDTPARAEQWIRKVAKAGRRQAEGTRRRLAQSSAVTFTSLRGYTRTLHAVNGWPAVVVIDHPFASAPIQSAAECRHALDHDRGLAGTAQSSALDGHDDRVRQACLGLGASSSARW